MSVEIKNNIIQWAKDKNLVKSENASKQLLKLGEEVGELFSAYVKNKPEEIEDAVGDIQVVLIILCEQLGVNYENCLESAYNVIKSRTGKTINGTFIKD
jgi:NTP pyrophosphatase (non-canonical NTP hydrolase)